MNNFLPRKRLMFLKQRLGKYKKLEKLGGGANGDVYKAKRLSDNRIVAIKYLKDFDFNSIRRFQNEIEIYQKLKRSPYIVKILDYSLESQNPYLVMEYCEFGNARNQINFFMNYQREGVRLLLGIAKGLKQIHRLGTFHRDIKPDNLLFTKNMLGNYVLKIGDAGMSCFLPKQNFFSNQTFTLQGTQNYIAPELFKGKSFNEKSDIYSFGVTCHELLTGIHPFAGQVITRGPIELQNLLQRMISSNVKFRPNIDEVISEMEIALQKMENKEFWQNALMTFGLGAAIGGVIGIGLKLLNKK